MAKNMAELKKSVIGNGIYLTGQVKNSKTALGSIGGEALIAETEKALDEADLAAKSNSNRLTHSEVFSALRGKMYGWYQS